MHKDKIHSYFYVKEWEERVYLGTRSERVSQNEERGRNETTFSERNVAETKRLIS